MSINRVIFIPAYGLPITKQVTKTVETGEIKKTFFGKEKAVTKTVKDTEVVGESDSQVDAVRLSDDLRRIVEEQNAEGYEVVSVTPIISGDYDYVYSEGNGKKIHAHKGSYGYGYGYSFTEGLTLVVKQSHKVGDTEN